MPITYVHSPVSPVFQQLRVPTQQSLIIQPKTADALLASDPVIQDKTTAEYLRASIKPQIVFQMPDSDIQISPIADFSLGGGTAGLPVGLHFESPKYGDGFAVSVSAGLEIETSDKNLKAFYRDIKRVEFGLPNRMLRILPPKARSRNQWNQTVKNNISHFSTTQKEDLSAHIQLRLLTCEASERKTAAYRKLHALFSYLHSDVSPLFV